MTPPTPQSFACRILGARAGRSVVPGEIVEVSPDVALSHDDTAQLLRRFADDDTRVCDPDLHVLVLDRCTPAADAAGAAGHRELRAFAERQGIEGFFDINAGVGHQLLPEQGFALPGRLLVGSDPRTTTAGALGLYATAIGLEGIAAVMTTGRATLRVPATARITVSGRLAPGIAPHDLALRLLGDLGAEGATGLALELCGPGLAAVTVTGRLALCGLLAATGAACVYIEPDAVTLAWLNGRARGNFDLVRGDADAPRAREFAVDAAAIVPLVARAGGARVAPLADHAGLPLDQVVIGGCAGGRLSDLRAAAAVLRGRRAAAGVRLLVLPATPEVTRAAALDGTLVTLLDAGATLLSPGCGPCCGRRAGLLAPGETGLGTTARLGGEPRDDDSTIGGDHWLASPLTCAASAATGRLTDARELVAPDALAAPDESL